MTKEANISFVFSVNNVNNTLLKAAPEPIVVETVFQLRGPDAAWFAAATPAFTPVKRGASFGRGTRASLTCLESP